MTREQIINLRPGQLVQIKLARSFWRIVKATVPETGSRVFELEAVGNPRITSHIFVGTDQIEWADRTAALAA